jgi:NAD(P)-dependent dehydrogenase (short-subunit alcohol dehydrogenase family)
METLAGKIALITGSARRLGQAMALTLAEKGVHIVIHYHESGDSACSLEQELGRYEVRAWTIQADLLDTGQVETLFTRTLALAGHLDILINNASIYPRETFSDVSPESLQAHMQIHAMAPLVLSRLFAQQKRPGHILNILDTRILSYDHEHLAYHLGKRSLLSLTRILARELAPDVAVNAIAPGLILPPAGQGDDYLQDLAHCNPLHKVGSTQDVTQAMLFLLQSQFITGQVLYVDGGYHMKGRMYE